MLCDNEIFGLEKQLRVNLVWPCFKNWSVIWGELGTALSISKKKEVDTPCHSHGEFGTKKQ